MTRIVPKLYINTKIAILIISPLNLMVSFAFLIIVGFEPKCGRKKFHALWFGDEAMCRCRIQSGLLSHLLTCSCYKIQVWISTF